MHSLCRRAIKQAAILYVCSLIFLGGCSELAPTQSTPTQAAAPTASPTPQATTAVTSTPAGPVTLRIWLSPELDPASGDAAGEILQARLDEFTARRPDVRLEVRIKAPTGPGGLVDSLSTASAAAPLSLPDLVALPRPDLEVAALKGLLKPFDGLIQPIEEGDWYEYARQLAHLQDSTFGLPFAGDALLLVYRSPVIPEPPRMLSDTLSTPGPLVFQASGPGALFTLAQYQAHGGNILDEQGRPSLEAQPLTQVLDYYQKAVQVELMPYWLTQYQDDEQTWQAFIDNNAPMVITWASRHLQTMLVDTAGSPLPTPQGKPDTLATGWVWAMASPNPEHQKLCASLAEFLSEGDFLAAWTSALGYLPPRSSALQNWGTPDLRILAKELVSTARLIPSEDVLNSLGPPLEEATLQILKLQSDPENAARQAVERLNAP